MGACLCLDRNLVWCETCQQYTSKPDRGLPCIHIQADTYYPINSQKTPLLAQYSAD